LGLAVGADAPVNHFGFIDFVAVCVFRQQAGGLAGAAFRIVHRTAFPADQMVMIVGAYFIPGGGAGGLDAVNQPLFRHQVQRVIDRLAGNGSDAAPDLLHQLVRERMRMLMQDVQNRQSLCGDLKSGLSQCLFGWGGMKHMFGLYLILDFVQIIRNKILWQGLAEYGISPIAMQVLFKKFFSDRMRK
jgi:hypothetical protein